MIKINKWIFIFFIANVIACVSCALAYYYEVSHTNPRISSDIVILSLCFSAILMFVKNRKPRLIIYHVWMFGMLSFLYYCKYVADYSVFIIEFMFSFWVWSKLKEERENEENTDRLE